MKSLKATLALAAISSAQVWSASELLAFDYTDGLAEGNRAAFRTVASDLLTGDRMRISRSSFCSKDNELFVLGSAPSVDSSKYSPEFILSLKPGNIGMISVTTDNMDDADRSDVILSAYSCGLFTPKKLIKIKSINNHESYKSYLESDFVQKLPYP